MKFTPIEEKWLLPNQLFALQFASGWTFHRVLSREFTRFKPYLFNLSMLSSDGTQDITELKDPVNTDERIIDVTEGFADRIIYHVGIGIAPAPIRVYPEYPTGDDLGRILSTDPTRLGDDKAYRNGVDSPYQAPTDAMEFWFPFTMTLGLGYHNPDNRDLQPVLNVAIMKYDMEVLRPAEAAHLIGAIARRQTAATPFTLGRLERPFEYTNSLRKAWSVDPIPLETARRMGGPTPAVAQGGGR